MDVVSAYLNGKISEEIYMMQPEGYDDNSGRFCRLKKSLYGLKQAGRVWNEELNRVLLNFGLIRSSKDQCIYFRIENNSILIITIYVDDFLIFFNNIQHAEELQQELSRNFKMKFLGKADTILGIRIQRDLKNKMISIDQERYIKDILTKFKMNDCNPVATPLDINQKISNEMSPTEQHIKDEMTTKPYRAAIGSLMQCCSSTRRL